MEPIPSNPQQPSSAISEIHNSALSHKVTRVQRIDLQNSPSPAVPIFPLTAGDAINHFGTILNEFEKLEIQSFSNEIYYLGQNCKKKIKGHIIKQKNTD